MVITVETPKGSPFKYKFDEQKQQFVVHKVLPGGMTFPFNFGFVPHTKGEDGDPLDVVVLSGSAHATGRNLDCRIIGCLPAEQTAGRQTIRNDRFLAVAESSASYNEITSIRQLPREMIADIESFFITYLAAEQKTVRFLPMLDEQEALQLLQISQSNFLK